MIALLPTAEHALDKLGVHSGGVATTWLRGAFDPRRAARPAPAQTDPAQRRPRSTVDFIARVAQARKTTPDKIDAVAQGRVWSGAQALERGLVDRVGSYGDALALGRGARPSSARIRASSTSSASRGRSRASSRCSTPKWPAALSASIDEKLNGMGLPASALAPARAELGWLAGLLERRKPFDAVAHCLCTVPF